MDLHYNQVGVWRKRYAAYGLVGLDDSERSGRPCVYDHDDVLLLVKAVTEPPPDQATRWSMEALSRVMSDHGVPISVSQCWRICRGLDLKAWQVRSWMTSYDPDFWVKAADVCALYLDLPTSAVVFSVDEKTGAGQGPRQPHPAGLARPGRAPGVRVRAPRPRRLMPPRAHPATCSDSSPTPPTASTQHLLGTNHGTPAELDPDVIVDNLSAHTTEKTAILLEHNPRVHLHFTPTHASWLNQVELFFSILERRLLRRGEFGSVDDLARRVIAFINDYNRRAAPFRWTYDGRPLMAA